MDLAELHTTLNSWPIHAPLQAICDPQLDAFGVHLYLKREDLIHPLVSGNKWRKLKYNLLRAKEEGHETLLTFGGAYSNHILATAAAGQLFGFQTIGIIRGEEYRPLNPVLAQATKFGMALHYLNRASYRHKDTIEMQRTLYEHFSPFYLIPEGGANREGVQGCQEIISEIEIDFDVICCACGTGTTLAGLISGLNSRQRALGIAVLKGENFLNDAVRSLLSVHSSVGKNWSICYNYHFNGYAKAKPSLLSFIDEFAQQTKIRLDRIYTGKMMFGLYELIQQGAFPQDTTIIALQTCNHPDLHIQ
ncbi:pyridoxal-phosphate dependent enzyme [Chloroflexi bacterium TSY]|nr:pyridoxal-phosphate dependent enzyme [Chloroflexi bacterium TSY]